MKYELRDGDRHREIGQGEEDLRRVQPLTRPPDRLDHQCGTGEQESLGERQVNDPDHDEDQAERDVPHHLRNQHPEHGSEDR